MIISKVLFFGLGAGGLAVLATTTAIYGKNITENSVVKYLFNSIYEMSHMDDLLLAIEQEDTPLDEDMPTYTLLSSKNSTDNGENETFGNRYRNVLVSNENNDDWGKWSIKKLNKAGTLTGEFAKLNNKGENDFAELRTTCETIHKKQDKELKDEERNNAGFLCSAIGKQPYSSEAIPKPKYRNKFGSSKENRSPHLIADRPANKNVWEELYKKLIPSATDEEFKKVKLGYSKKYDKTNPSLNKICDEFYSKTMEEVTSSKENIGKYCSLPGKDITSSNQQKKET